MTHWEARIHQAVSICWSYCGKRKSAFGSVLADLIWFYLGRYRGHRVLNLLRRTSLEPDSCVRRTQNVFTRYGMRGVIVAKFIPPCDKRLWRNQ